LWLRCLGRVFAFETGTGHSRSWNDAYGLQNEQL
jgi:hypothetical protein